MTSPHVARPLTMGLASAVAVVALAVASVPGVPGWPPALLLLALAVALRPPSLLRRPRPRLGFVARVAAPPLLASGFGIATHVGLTPGAAAALVCALGLVLVLLAPPSPGRDAAVVRVAVLVMTVAAAFAPPEAAVVCCVLFVATLVPALLASPFGPAAGAGTDETLVRRVVAAPQPAPAAGRGRFAMLLLAAALLYGGVLHAALPREGPQRERGKESSGSMPSLDLLGGTGRAGERGVSTGGFAGPRSTHAAFLRANQRVELELRFEDGLPGPSPLYVRGMVYDTFDGVGWERSSAAATYDEVRSDAQGWASLEAPGPRRPRWNVELRDRTGRGARTALWLLPGADRVWLPTSVRAGGVTHAHDGAVFLGTPSRWRPDAVYRTQGPALGHDRAAAEGRRSSADVAPLPTHVAPPPEAAPIRALVAPALAGATGPAERAARLEAWLSSTAFRYRLSDHEGMPPGDRLDRQRPVADFLARVREGNCWCFASAMTVAMRALGHPARLAVGYRPHASAYLQQARIWTLRGIDAHAWCEVFYEGVGWVIYDPTPPDARAEDAGEGGSRRAAGSELDGWLPVGGLADLFRWIVPAILLLALLVALRRSPRARRGHDRAGAAAADPTGIAAVYARALALLARLGVVRRDAETPREFLGRALPSLPPADPALGRLTTMHGTVRYGGEAFPAPALDEAKGALTALEAAVAAARARRAAAGEGRAPRVR